MLHGRELEVKVEDALGVACGGACAPKVEGLRSARHEQGVGVIDGPTQGLPASERTSTAQAAMARHIHPGREAHTTLTHDRSPSTSHSCLDL